VDVRVVFQSLIPGVEDGEKPDARAEPLWIGSHFGEGFGDGAEQDAVDDSRILKSQGRQLMREREDHMSVRNGQDLFGPLRQPLVACPTMAFRAMPVSARAVLDRLVGAMIALLDAGAKRGGSACADVAECLELLARQHIAPALQELLSVLAEDIGDFQSLVAHHWRASL